MLGPLVIEVISNVAVTPHNHYRRKKATSGEMAF